METTPAYDPTADRDELLAALRTLIPGRDAIPTDELSRRLVWPAARVHFVLHSLQGDGLAEVTFDGVRALARPLG